MSKRILAWILVSALLQGSSVWADPLGETQGPVESAVVSPIDAGRASEAEKVVANLAITMAMKGVQATPREVAAVQPPAAPLAAAKGPPKPGVVEEKDLDQVITDAGGQILLIMIGTPGCGPCPRTIPLLDDLAKKYGNVTVIVVEVGTAKAAVDKIAKDNPNIVIVRVAGDEPPKIFPPVTTYPTIVTPAAKGGYTVLVEGKPSAERLKAWEEAIKKHQEER